MHPIVFIVVKHIAMRRRRKLTGIYRMNHYYNKTYCNRYLQSFPGLLRCAFI